MRGDRTGNRNDMALDSVYRGWDWFPSGQLMFRLEVHGGGPAGVRDVRYVVGFSLVGRQTIDILVPGLRPASPGTSTRNFIWVGRMG